MKQWLFFLALTVILVACSDGVQKSYWDNGKLKSELRYENDKLNGECVWYYQSGGKMSQGFYVDDVLDGCFMRWYPNGKLSEEGWYKNGLRDSIGHTYSEKGFLASEEHYRNGELDGEIKKWYDNGQLFQEGQYVEGMMDGQWFIYYPSGALAGKAIYQKGTGKQTGYDESGYKCLEVSYVNNQKHGKEIHYNPLGEVVQVVEYEHGVKVDATAAAQNPTE